MNMSALLAAPALALGAVALAAAPASATDDTWSFQTRLAPVNNSTAGGHAVVDVTGDQATVTVEVSGAPALFDALAADADADGVVSSMEGQPWAGAIGASLTTAGDTSPASGAAVDRFPAGDSYSYQRTITLDAATLGALRAGNAVLNVHGADPASLSPAAQAKANPMAPALPLASDVPIACGTLLPTQMELPLPEGPADTGVGTASAEQDTDGITGAAALGIAVLGGAALVARHRSARGR